jgi:hypothetical protein
MEPLFDNTVTAGDPKYNYIRSDSGQTAKVTKMFTESLWVKYQPYADCNFAEQIRRDFDARFWEMYLACTLMDKGYEFTGKTSKNAGPDIRVKHKGNIIWIEATAPTAGNQSSSDRVPELVITNPPTAQEVPDEQIILRYRASIKEKYDYKYFEYLKSGIIGKEDFYLVAINGCRIPHSRTERELPRIVRSVLPFGHSQVTINTVSMQIISADHQYRAHISKASGCPVRTDIFLDPCYQHISAVLFSNVDVFNLTGSMGDDFVTVHNPLAHPLPDDFLNFGQQWKAELRENEITVSPKN